MPYGVKDYSSLDRMQAVLSDFADRQVRNDIARIQAQREAIERQKAEQIWGGFLTSLQQPTVPQEGVAGGRSETTQLPSEGIDYNQRYMDALRAQAGMETQSPLFAKQYSPLFQGILHNIEQGRTEQNIGQRWAIEQAEREAAAERARKETQTAEEKRWTRGQAAAEERWLKTEAAVEKRQARTEAGTEKRQTIGEQNIEKRNDIAELRRLTAKKNLLERTRRLSKDNAEKARLGEEIPIIENQIIELNGKWGWKYKGQPAPMEEGIIPGF